MKTMRLPTINSQSQQQQPGRFPQILPNSGSTCKTAFGVGSNMSYEQPYRPAVSSKPISTSINSISSKQSPPLLGLYRSTMNHLNKAQQCAVVASLVNKSSNAREQMLKKQLMKAVMNHQPGHGYLEFLRKYAENATSSSNNVRQEFDYLDYIRRDAAEEFRRNGVEVANFENFRVTDGGRSLSISQVGEGNSRTSMKEKGRESILKHVEDSAIISYGDFTTSMNNHEPQESNFETYNASPKKPEDFSSSTTNDSQANSAPKNRRNIFRNSRSHRRRRSDSRKRQGSSERPRSRAGKTIPPPAVTVPDRRPRRSKPYDGASQRARRPLAGNHPNEKRESRVSPRTAHPSTPDNSKFTRSTMG